MSRENIEIIRMLNAAFNRGDLETMFSYYEPTAIWHSREDEPDTGDYEGLDAIRELADMWLTTFDDFRFLLDDYYVDVGDCVVTSGWISGRGRDSGAEVREQYVWVLRLRDGKVAEVWEYRDRDEALEAVGLKPQGVSLPRG